MPEFVFDNVMRVLHETGIKDIRFTGGEPTIHPRFIYFVETALKEGFKVGLISNGSFLRQERLPEELLSQFSRIWISLYGLSSSQHAYISERSNGGAEFDSVLRSVGNLSQSNERIGIGVSLVPGSNALVRTFLNKALEFGIRKVRLLPIQADGRALGLSKSTQMSGEEVKELVSSMETWPEINDFTSLTINDMNNVENSSFTKLSSCLLQTRRMPAFIPNGNVYGCCYNAYHEDALVGSLRERDKIIEYLLSPKIPPVCRAFNEQAKVEPCQKCPISIKQL